MSKVNNKLKKTKNEYKLSSSKITSTKKKSIRYSKSRSEISDMINKFEGIDKIIFRFNYKRRKFHNKENKRIFKRKFFL